METKEKPSHHTMMTSLKGGRCGGDAVNRAEKDIADRAERANAKNMKFTSNMLTIVFLEQNANMPFRSHTKILEMFDVVGHSKSFGEYKTHRGDYAAAKMTKFISKSLEKCNQELP